MNRASGVLNVRHICRRDPTRICKDSEGVVDGAHEGHGGENDGVHNSGRRREAEPPFDEYEDCGEVDKGDCRDDDSHRRRKIKAPLHLIGKRVRETHRRQGDGGSGEEGEFFRLELRGSEASDQRLNVESPAAPIACVLRIWALVCSSNESVPLLGGYSSVN